MNDTSVQGRQPQALKAKEIIMSQQVSAVSNVGRLAGKVAIVTGASKGIGAAIAKTLAAQGAAVVVNYASSAQDGQRVVDDIVSAGGRAIAVGANLGKEGEVERLFAATSEAYGRLDILVNNAGVYAFGGVETVSRAAITAMFDVNVTGLLMSIKAAVAAFPPEGGNIVNIGSVVGELPPATASVYAGTKGAVNAITRSLAKELGPRKIRVNTINPGAVMTEGFKAGGFAGEFEQWAVDATPLGRIGQPQDIANAVSMLVSDEAGWITGSLVDAAGGWR
jgi:3-oxoacyl-[acyl-carrier protein] reductase